MNNLIFTTMSIELYEKKEKSGAVAPVNTDEESADIDTRGEVTPADVSVGVLLKYAEPIDYAAMFLGALGGIIVGASFPAFNVLFGQMLDQLNEDPSSFGKGIERISLLLVYLAIINIFAGFMQVYGWTYAGERMSTKWREAYVRAILSQEIGWFDTIGASELTTRVADLSGKITDGLTRKAGELFQFGAQSIGSFIVAFYFCWELTVVLLAAIPCIAGTGAFMISAITSATTGSGENYARAGGIAGESLQNIRTVTALNGQPDIISRYRIFLLEAMQIGIIKGLKVGIGNGMLFCACFLTYSLGFWYGGGLVADAIEEGNTDLTGGTILSVFFCVLLGSIALGQVVPPVSAFIGAKTSVGPMLSVIDREPGIDGMSDEGKKLSKVQGDICLKDVNFAYPSRPNINVCNQYSLDIKAGETVALVGASGAGKSTIINLLLRFYDVQSGAVMLDGINVRDLNIKWLRSKIGLVSQEPILFSGSIADNIGYGLGPDHSLTPAERQERIEEAAKQANAAEFITGFPRGYDTDVGTGGISLSGGQKQRIAIARALVKKPALLLLDEATSALDAASEKVVQASIDDLQSKHSYTTLIVAHRLSTIKNADKIALVSNGVIAELGTHDELIAKRGLYADLVSLQMDDIADDNDSDPMEATLDGYVPKVKTPRGGASTTNGASETDRTDDSEDKIPKEEETKLMRNIQSMIFKHPFWLGVSLFGSAAFGSMFPCWGLLLAKTQDLFYNEDTDKLREEATEVSLWYILLASVALISSTLQFWGTAHVSERVSMRLRSDYFEAIIRREIGFFDFEENSAGALATRLADDSRAVTKAMGDNTPRQLQALFTLGVGLGLGFSASWRLALVVIATFPVTIAASAIQMQAVAGQQYDNSGDGDEEEGQSAGGIIDRAFNNMRTVSAFSMQRRCSDDYNKKTLQQSQDRTSSAVVAGLGHGLSQACTFATYALLFWYGSTLIEDGDIEFEDMMVAIMSLMLGGLGLGQALGDLGDQKTGLLAAKRIFDAIDEGKNAPIDALSLAGAKPTSRPTGSVELRGIHFSYPTRPEVKVAKDYNLVINPGEVVALVGPSGSGKSTIMSLLLRFYDPAQGEVLLDGQPIKDLNVRWLRSQIGYVGQEPVLFSGSVASNISKGRASFGDSELLSLDDAIARSDEDVRNNTDSSKRAIEANAMAGMNEQFVPDADIVEAATASNAHKFLSEFTEGYKTDVGEGSIMVSGGQKQRIAIARALVKKPSILLLDEATSALDAASERLVQASIDELQQSKAQTTIVIAHRLTTIKNADKIAVIDKGAVVATGTHDELLADDKGLYHQLWMKQQGKKTKSSDDLAGLAGA